MTDLTDYRDDILEILALHEELHLHIMERGPSYHRTRYVKLNFCKSELCATKRCIKLTELPR